MKKSVFTYLFFALFTLSATAKTTEEIVEVKVDGVTRRALVITHEKKSEKSPLVFVFHGRRGTMFGLPSVWEFTNIGPKQRSYIRKECG